MNSNLITAVAYISGLGLLFGIILAVASKLFAVRQDPMVENVLCSLPGVNCGACGYSGCEAYAKAVVSGEADITLCTVGGKAVACKIAELTGREAGDPVRKVARVLCGGTSGNRKTGFEYEGLETCVDAAMLYGGDNVCSFGCLGRADCMRACPYDAITMVDGVAFIIEDKCMSCEICVGACPKGIIEMVPEDAAVTIACSNKDRGAVAMKGCSTACIACGKCVRECPVDAIEINHFLAKIDYDKCINCGKCIKVCPTDAILRYNDRRKILKRKNA